MYSFWWECHIVGKLKSALINIFIVKMNQMTVYNAKGIAVLNPLSIINRFCSVSQQYGPLWQLLTHCIGFPAQNLSIFIHSHNILIKKM